MSKPMPKQKAAKIMKDYAANEFNKSKTLRDNGYADSTIEAQAGRVLNTAERVVKEALNLDESLSTQETAQTVLDIVGYDRSDILKHYKFVVEQERDLPSKLKALAPLLRAVGVHLDESVAQTVIPVLNIGITERNDGSTEPYVASVSGKVDCATQNNGYIEAVPMEGEGRQDETPV